MYNTRKEEIREAAEEVIDKFYITKPEDIDLEAIAGYENIWVKEEIIKSHDGRFIWDGSKGIISINANIAERGKKRFTIAHELGHYYLEKENENEFICNIDESDFEDYIIREREASEFATELLMPRNIFQKYAKWQGSGKDTIEAAANKFGTTISATALRYADIGEEPIAVIMSKDFRILWYKINRQFPFQELKRQLNKRAGCTEYFSRMKKTEGVREIEPEIWFEDEIFLRDIVLKEEHIYITPYGKVLTIITKEKI